MILQPFFPWNMEQWLQVCRAKRTDKHLVTLRLIEAIIAAHRAGFAHGNIKPSNVLFKGHCDPYLSDWSLEE